MKERSLRSVILGAAFLMATSAVGPGFLTQTTVFTGQLLASFGFVILVSVVLDIFAQLNIWRVLTVRGKRAQDVANEAIAGSGYVLAALVVFGGLVFNVGNIAGCGLGFNVLFGIPVEVGAVISSAIAIAIFLVKDAGKLMDLFVKILGVVMLVLIVYVVYAAQPPLIEAAYRTLIPQKIDARAIVTLVGGTVGGYITFAGAHRLIDAGISGPEALGEVNRSAVMGITITAAIRVLLFLAALGVVSLGFSIDAANPPASVFQNAAGWMGYKIFGVVMWAAAITSVVGAAYTSVSFFKSFHEKIEARSNQIIVAFIVFSTIIFLTVGRPVTILVWAGTINGFILPVGLALVLLASRRSGIAENYHHPRWLEVAGWIVVAVMTIFSILTLVEAGG
ncbi:MAG TPA: NRAMP family divalent metal transporter [Pyrinomonadaceae bacterium]|nr:NRAMP family divalent metal transporter [Pyrinomonadaceae bacterium]